MHLSAEMLSCIRQKFKQLIADAYMTFQGTRGAKHGAQPWQKHHFFVKGVYEKDQQKKREYIRRFLTASRTMKYFMQASYIITGQKNGANIWITLEQTILRTMPLRNNWNDTLPCIFFGTIQNIWRTAL